MGTLVGAVARETKGPVPAVLFDNVKDYPKGYGFCLLRTLRLSGWH